MKKEDLVNEFVELNYSFKGQWDMPSICGLKIIRKPDQIIVIATELYDINPGTSVTAFCAPLATQIINEFHIKPEELVFIEQTPDRGSKMLIYSEAFDIVDFEWDGKKFNKPVWKRITKDELLKLIS